MMVEKRAGKSFWVYTVSTVLLTTTTDAVTGGEYDR